MSTPSPTLRLTQIVFAIVFCLLAAGVIFGFAALKPVLVSEGVYSDLCLPGEREKDENGAWRVCIDQDTRLNLMFTLASVITNVVCLPVGYTMDRLGPLKTALIGSLLFFLGNFSFGLGYRSAYFDSYVFGFILLGIGGPLVFLPQFHLSNAFPAYSGVILAAITGAFDASSIPYVFYRMAYDATDGALNVRLFFWCYMIVPCLIVVEQLMFAPRTTYQRLVSVEDSNEPPYTVDEPAVGPPLSSLPGGLARRSPSHVRSEAGTDMSNASAGVAAFSSFSRINYGDAHDDDEGMLKEHAPKDAITGVMYGKTAGEQIMSKWFVLLTLFVCTHMTRINFYVMSVDSQLEHYTGSTVLAEKLTTAFTVLLPIGGVVGIPFVGLLLDYRPLLDVIAVLAAMGLGFGILGMTSAVWSQLIAICIFVVFRPLMYTVVSDSFAKVFGFQTFGTVYGLAMTLSGCFGLLNAPMDLLVKNKLDGNFMPIGVTLVVAGFSICSALWFIVWKETKKSQGGQIRLED